MRVTIFHIFTWNLFKQKLNEKLQEEHVIKRNPEMKFTNRWNEKHKTSIIQYLHLTWPYSTKRSRCLCIIFIDHLKTIFASGSLTLFPYENESEPTSTTWPFISTDDIIIAKWMVLARPLYRIAQAMTYCYCVW